MLTASLSGRMDHHSRVNALLQLREGVDGLVAAHALQHAQQNRLPGQPRAFEYVCVCVRACVWCMCVCVCWCEKC